MDDIVQVWQSAYPTRVNQTTFGTRSIRYDGAKSRNTYQTHLNRLGPLKFFKSVIKTWEGPNYKCNFCKHLVSKPYKLPSH